MIFHCFKLFYKDLLRNTAVACQIGSSRFSLPALQGYIDELKIFYEPIDQYSIDIQKDMKAKDIEKKWLRKFVPSNRKFAFYNLLCINLISFIL